MAFEHCRAMKWVFSLMPVSREPPGAARSHFYEEDQLLTAFEEKGSSF
jgi:hypothetical protein